LRATGQLLAMIEAQRGTLLLWMPVWLGIGIALWFLLPDAPAPPVLAAIAGGVTACLVAARATRGWPRAVLLLPALVGVGLLDIAWSAHRVGAPVLEMAGKPRLTGPVQGRVTMVDRSSRGQLRLTLDRVVLPRVAPASTPARVRVSLRARQLRLDPVPGARVMVTATLVPPAGPVAPGAFDFRRHAWFRRLGAVGYARGPALEYAPPRQDGVALRLAAFRMRLARAIRARIKGQAGAFASAILTGDRTAIDPGLLGDLRNSNLAHLLAISGLHMGLLAGFVLAALRYGLALVPWLALRLPVKRIAAVAALAAGLGYMILSGASIATQRAFVMLAVMLVALLLDRRAFSLRAVALAAVLVLLWRPESLVEAGFQMSFAATAALIAVFEALRNLRGNGAPAAIDGLLHGKGRLSRPLRWLGALALSSATAGLATAPLAAWQFHRLVAYGLLANLATVPVMGLLVMPAGVLAILGEILAPASGASQPFWSLMGAGIDWILTVAREVSSWRGAVHPVPAAPWPVLAAIIAGGLMLVLLRGRVRLIGAIPLVAGLLAWGQVARPDLLIARDGGLVGAMTGQGRWLSRARGAGFAARVWLERDGDAATQREAAARPPPPWLAVLSRSPRAPLPAGTRVVLVTGKGMSPAAISASCAAGILVILPRMAWPAGLPRRACRVIDRPMLIRAGAVSVDLRARGFGIVTVSDETGRRPWSQPALPGHGRAPAREMKPALADGPARVAQ